jgi:hypothetical protein
MPLQIGLSNVRYVSKLIYLVPDCIYSMEYHLNPLFHVQENLNQDSIYCQASKKVSKIKFEGNYFFHYHSMANAAPYRSWMIKKVKRFGN